MQSKQRYVIELSDAANGRLSTGIDGLDALIGGYPEGKTILVSGDSGTGKTTLALHFLNACCKAGMKCLYLTTEERPDELKAQAMSFGWDLEEYENRGLMVIQSILEQILENLLVVFSQGYVDSGLPFISVPGAKKRWLADVIIIDNIGTLAIGMPVSKVRRQLDSVISKLSGKLKRTALIVCDDAVLQMTNNVMMYSAYGAIKLMKRDNFEINKRERVMDIVKMRNTKIPLEYLQFDITGNGIELITRSQD